MSLENKVRTNLAKGNAFGWNMPILSTKPAETICKIEQDPSAVCRSRIPLCKKVQLVGHETSRGWIHGRSLPNPIATKLEPVGCETQALGQGIAGTADQRVTAIEIRQFLKARRARAAFFGADLFADPAWDILLFTYAAHLDQQRVSIGAVCESAGVPSTTALRWINKLEQDGWVTRSNDPLDGRRAWIELSATGVERMERYLDSVFQAALLV